MGKRSGAVETSADVDTAPLSWFNAEIKRSLLGYEIGETSQGRKAFFKRLVWIEGSGSAFMPQGSDADLVHNFKLGHTGLLPVQNTKALKAIPPASGACMM